MTVNAHAVPNVVSQNENSMKSRSEINMDHDIKLATSDFQEFLLVLYHDMKYGEGGNGLVSKLKNSFRKAKNFIIGGIAGAMLYSGSARADLIRLSLGVGGPDYLGGESISLKHTEGGEEGYDPGDGWIMAGKTTWMLLSIFLDLGQTNGINIMVTLICGF